VDTAPSGTGDAFPSISRDGWWIYFSRTDSLTNNGHLWRIHPDGTGGAELTTQQPGSDFWPTSSPDGSTIAYVDTISSHLRTLNLATGAVTDLGIAARSPQWSPTSNTIAYLATSGLFGPLAIVNSDGSDAHLVSSDSYQADIDYSPDGQWIIAVDQSPGLIELINVSTRTVQELTPTVSVGIPAWVSGGSSFRHLSPTSPPSP
jgi:Tol biopolymer transport system component